MSQSTWLKVHIGHGLVVRGLPQALTLDQTQGRSATKDQTLVQARVPQRCGDSPRETWTLAPPKVSPLTPSPVRHCQTTTLLLSHLYRAHVASWGA